MSASRRSHTPGSRAGRISTTAPCPSEAFSRSSKPTAGSTLAVRSTSTTTRRSSGAACDRRSKPCRSPPNAPRGVGYADLLGRLWGRGSWSRPRTDRHIPSYVRRDPCLRPPKDSLELEVLGTDDAPSFKPAFRPLTLHHRSSTCTRVLPLHVIDGLPIIPHAQNRPAALAGNLK